MPPPPSPFPRPPSPVERIYWLLDQTWSTNFVVTARCQGHLHPTHLAEAWRHAQARHPLLRVRIQVADSPRGTLTPAEPAPLPLERDESAPAWQAAVARACDTPFPVGSHPLVRAGAWHDSQQTWLRFTFHHGLMDAIGAACLVRDLVADAAGVLPSLSSRPALPPPEDCHPPAVRGLRGAWGQVRAAFADLAARWRRGAPRPLDLPPRFQRSRPGSRQVRVRSVTLDPEATRGLLRWCRQVPTSVHGALGAALLRALRPEYPGSEPLPLGLHSAVNVRPWLQPSPQDEDLGLYAGILATTHPVALSGSPAPLAADVRNEVQRVIRQGTPLRMWRVFPSWRWFPPDERGAARLARFFTLVPPSPVLTNLGAIPPRPGSPLLAMGFAMAPIPGSPLTAAVATTHDRLWIQCAYGTAWMPEDRQDRITRRLEQELRELSVAAPGGA